eukprot:scaffold22994_cov145-Amphora_coffeaeformis.AAC.1
MILTIKVQQELDHWIHKFHNVHHYPVVGRLIPDTTLQALAHRTFSPTDLAQYNGVANNDNDISNEYATPPIYVGIGYDVFDVSFGGTPLYGPTGGGGGYHCLAGKNATRALATMNLAEAVNASDTTTTTTTQILQELTDKQRQTLQHWSMTFRDTKEYPIVGKLL